jgi:hypothetical protein
MQQRWKDEAGGQQVRKIMRLSEEKRQHGQGKE